MKRMMCAVGLAVFLWCSCTVFVVDLIPETRYVGSRRVVAQLLQQERTEQAQLQQELARWYNLNLTSVRQDADFQAAYWDILDFADHAFGVLSVPSVGLKMPIYHGTSGRSGAGHVPTTAFPMGQPGEHCVLQVPVKLEAGTCFYIHILQKVLAYRITETTVASVSPGEYSGEQDSALCTLIFPEVDGVTIMQAQLNSDAPPEREVKVETVDASDGWLEAVWIVLAMGILLVPFLMWCRNG